MREISDYGSLRLEAQTSVYEHQRRPDRRTSARSGSLCPSMYDGAASRGGNDPSEDSPAMPGFGCGTCEDDAPPCDFAEQSQPEECPEHMPAGRADESSAPAENDREKRDRAFLTLILLILLTSAEKADGALLLALMYIML